MATDINDKSKESTSSPIKDFSNAEKSLKAELSSESLPADWDKGPVIKLVGKNFHEIAFDAKKDVFVDFYAEWCGFCRILEPIWTKLGEHYQESPDVVIAKIDGTLNDLPDVDLNVFPSLKLFRKGDNKIIEYSKQNKSLSKLIAFVDNGGELSPSPHESEEEHTDDLTEHGAEDTASNKNTVPLSEDIKEKESNLHAENNQVQENHPEISSRKSVKSKKQTKKK